MSDSKSAVMLAGRFVHFVYSDRRCCQPLNKPRFAQALDGDLVLVRWDRRGHASGGLR